MTTNKELISENIMSILDENNNKISLKSIQKYIEKSHYMLDYSSEEGIKSELIILTNISETIENIVSNIKKGDIVNINFNNNNIYIETNIEYRDTKIIYQCYFSQNELELLKQNLLYYSKYNNYYFNDKDYDYDFTKNICFYTYKLETNGYQQNYCNQLINDILNINDKNDQNKLLARIKSLINSMYNCILSFTENYILIKIKNTCLNSDSYTYKEFYQYKVMLDKLYLKEIQDEINSFIINLDEEYVIDIKQYFKYV
jgi:hypothetical protein